MAEYLIQDTTLDAIADAINAKTGGSSAMTPAEMVDAIDSITGGGDGNYAKKTGTFTLESNYTYAGSVAGAYTGSILIDTGLLRIDALIVWSEEWADGSVSANSFGLSLGFNNDIPVSDGAVASPFSYYSGYSFIWNGSTRPRYTSQLQGIIFHNATNGVPEGKFGLRCHSASFPIIAGHTIHWSAWGVGDQDDLPIVDGIVIKARNANGYPTEIDIYGDTIYQDTVYGNPAYATDYNAYWIGSIHAVSKPKTVKANAFRFNGGANYPVIISGLENVEYVGGHAFYTAQGQGNSGIKPVNFTDLDFSKIKAINEYCFYGTNLSGDIAIRQDCTAPERWPTYMFFNTKISSFDCAAPIRFNGYNFKNCTLLETAVLSRAITIGTQEFMGCTNLKTVILGSVGYEASIQNSAFSGCTQSDLTITAFAKGANVDSRVASIRNGATNATIIIKASENTTYNGTSYAAGDTILTSEVSA